MIDKNFRLIYQTLLEISKKEAFFDEEKKLVKIALKGLESMDAKEMYLKVVQIGLRQGGIMEGERKIIQIAQDCLGELLRDPELFERK